MPENARKRLAAEVPGLAVLRRLTQGDPRVCVAVLDGPVDLDHASLRGADLTVVELSATGRDPTHGPAAVHGTHVASLIFGRGGVEGVAPACRGLVVPVFRGGDGADALTCSAVDLARAMLVAADRGANVINVSGGQLSDPDEAHPLLADAVRACKARGVLVVAAAGNDGCACLHVPAALPGVLAVGATGRDGRPLASSNFGDAYHGQGLLAPGEALEAARSGGGLATMSGSSVAAAVVSGVAALLLSLDAALGRPPNGERAVRLLLDNTEPCLDDLDGHRRCLAGRLDVARVLMSSYEEVRGVNESASVNSEIPGPTPAGAFPAADATVTASGCGCASCAAGEAARPLVFALGKLGIDLVSEARRDSLAHHFEPPATNPGDPAALLAHLERHPYEAASVHWTLVLDQTPIYAVAPAGPYAALAYERLRKFLDEQTKGEIERVSIPGRIVGRTTLFNGQVVPTVEPELRGMYSWNTAALATALAAPAAAAAPGRTTRRPEHLRNFLDRVYFELRNLGVTSQERAINYAATNAFQVNRVYERALHEDMELDLVEVERSPVCRPESDCWDVKLLFFYPGRQVQSVRLAFRFTVDVSDVVPVMVGPERSWFIR